MVAIAKAKGFSMYASSYTFNEAMSYAKDKKQRTTVQSYIDSTKKSYSQYKRQQRHNRVMANGGYVKFGLEIMDFGFAGITSGDEGQSTMYYNMGLSVKFETTNPLFNLKWELSLVLLYSNIASPWYDYDSYYGYDRAIVMKPVKLRHSFTCQSMQN